MSLLTGITGGMGSGKTLVASIFLEFGAHILDADAICRKLVEPGQPALKEISEYFGENIIQKRHKKAWLQKHWINKCWKNIWLKVWLYDTFA